MICPPSEQLSAKENHIAMNKKSNHDPSLGLYIRIGASFPLIQEVEFCEEEREARSGEWLLGRQPTVSAITTKLTDAWNPTIISLVLNPI